jgi:hypothetical protein
VAALPADELEAVDRLRRIDGVAGAAARVLVLAGARGPAWEGELLARDAVLVDGDDDVLVAFAVQRLVAQGANARPLGQLPPRPVRALAAVGLAVPGALRSALPRALRR